MGVWSGGTSGGGERRLREPVTERPTRRERTTTTVFVGTNPENAANFYIAHRSGGVLAIVGRQVARVSRNGDFGPTDTVSSYEIFHNLSCYYDSDVLSSVSRVRCRTSPLQEHSWTDAVF